MIRTFEQHRVRAVQSLDGLWDFRLASTPDTKRPPPPFL